MLEVSFHGNLQSSESGAGGRPGRAWGTSLLTFLKGFHPQPSGKKNQIKNPRLSSASYTVLFNYHMCREHLYAHFIAGRPGGLLEVHPASPLCRATDGPHHCSGHCSQEPAGAVNTAEVFCARKTSLGLEGLKTDN